LVGLIHNPLIGKENVVTTQVINTEKAPAAIGPYSQGILAGGILFVSGQLGMDPASGELVGEDLASQTRQALANLNQIVKASGLSLKDIAAVDVFLTDMAQFAEFNQIYEDFIGDHRPARAVIEVSALPKGGCVEIKGIVVKSD
jgi:2-iminobutanoate/2-iminopropanoate deaminase